MARKDMRLADQLVKRQSWKDALVDAVVATILVRRMKNCAVSIIDGWEILVTRRVKGAEKDQYQGHHGGFLKTTDRDIYEGATREVLEETGYELDPNLDLTYLASIGPALYRSELAWNATKKELVLRISEEEAESNVAFVLPLFVADASGKKPRNKTDGEVDDARWLTVRQIIEEFGSKGNRSYNQFNYFQILTLALLFLAGKWCGGQRPYVLPGEYHFTI